MSAKSVASLAQSVVLLFDVSPSMGESSNGARPAIWDLNDASAQFIHELRQVTTSDVEVMFITFSGDVVVEGDFESVASVTPPVMSVRGSGTDLGGGLGRAMQEVKSRKDFHKALGTEALQPWIVCITDGQPNLNSHPGFDSELVDLINHRKLHFIPVAVGGHGSYEVLERLSPALKPIVINPGSATGTSFRDFFTALSGSVASGQIKDLKNLQPHE